MLSLLYNIKNLVELYLCPRTSLDAEFKSDELEYSTEGILKQPNYSDCYMATFKCLQ
jgi:hypothetical protein